LIQIKAIILVKNKLLLTFLAKFFVSYFLLLAIYWFYLGKTQEKTTIFSCAPITNIVAKQSVSVINAFGYEASAFQHNNELSLKVLVNNKYIARVIEGCNGISVIILFLAFIIAFSGKIATTIIFGLLGSLLIYGLNIIRIALLAIGLYKYPKHESLFHDLLFPAIIYGFIVLLWLIWVKKFANKIKVKNV
jgi:exosortase family protein XrtF